MGCAYMVSRISSAESVSDFSRMDQPESSCWWWEIEEAAVSPLPASSRRMEPSIKAHHRTAPHLEDLVDGLGRLLVDGKGHERLAHAWVLGALAREDVGDLHLAPLARGLHVARLGEGRQLLRHGRGRGGDEGLAELEAGAVHPHGAAEVLERHRVLARLEVGGHALGEELWD